MTDEATMVEALKRLGPTLVGVTQTGDMGYEFTAFSPEGVIFPEPGMLLGPHEGSFPPSEWSDLNQDEFKKMFAAFLVDFEATPWEEVELDTIIDFYQEFCER